MCEVDSSKIHTMEAQRRVRALCILELRLDVTWRRRGLVDESNQGK